MKKINIWRKNNEHVDKSSSAREQHTIQSLLSQKCKCWNKLKHRSQITTICVCLDCGNLLLQLHHFAPSWWQQTKGKHADGPNTVSCYIQYDCKTKQPWLNSCNILPYIDGFVEHFPYMHADACVLRTKIELTEVSWQCSPHTCG